MLVSTTLSALAVMVALGLILAGVLVIASRKLFVYEDPRINVVETMLPGSNCGACGKPGCRAFAEQAVSGGVSPGQCTVSSEEARDRIAEYLGVDVGGNEKQVARLACAGGSNVARQRARYDGVSTCQLADLVAGGGKGCPWGCLGFGDCMEVCDFDAITMNAHSLPVVNAELCTACGDCVEICPRNLFELHAVSHRLWVACKNLALAEEAESECAVACNGCGRCAADAPQGLIRMVDNLAVVDYAHNELASTGAIQRCPTGAIVWLRDGTEAMKGPQAKPVVRHHALPVG